ncbi:regulatory protein RecX [Cellvibrio zantedeschiae]|uniref:Regulatory protein RecX n=1 Tax=Cellvibrio zantedeschiae TaxID=1237077 RepID=A0ABQ3ATB0_9GAMM|nr:regulatory protein RecX [Cellvibrio zantedeschiae]GGY66684.1 regulatory protein RecX [Cellvibrio zantedeschiae]
MTVHEITPASIRMSAMNFLAMREHSAHELKVKLSKKFDHPDWIARELEKLKQDGLQSDERFTEAYISMRLRQGKGALVIRLELKEKGISDALASQYLSSHTDWNQLALKAYVKKFGNTLVSDMKEKSRRIRFLTARGFSSANIQYALKQSLEGDD